MKRAGKIFNTNTDVQTAKSIQSLKKYFVIGLLTFVLLQISSFHVLANEHQPQKEQVATSSNHQHPDVDKAETLQHGEASTNEESHGSDMSPLFFIVITLFIGVGVRHIFKRSPLPYTVTLLLVGFLIGVFQRMGWFASIDVFNNSINWAANIDPHLILYVFLPTLIFEAAFAMDVHTFRKIFANALILAVPGILVAIALTGVLCMALSSYGFGMAGWSWTIALLFGSLISATDPVAVVSLLKELGTSKKLGTLVDGESLLNDGTAIVFFMVFFNLLIGVSEGMSFMSVVSQFFVVSFGGVLVGLLIGWLVNIALKKVFNDPLFEITIIVSAAYMIFFIAENLFHVSGVLGLVTYGLMMAGVGRTRISPEVNHFLHEFWELAAFIANTLIFVIVGVIIAEKTVFNANDFLILIYIYLGITIIRALMIGMFYPLMKRFGYGIDLKNGFVLWYGGLRGAIGLALALIIAGAPQIPLEIRNQILFYTAGIVALTSLINATTIGFFIKKMGLTNVSKAKAQMITNNNIFIRESSEGMLSKLKLDRFMSGANWDKVREYLPEVHIVEADDTLETNSLYEIRKRILIKEKSTYWKQFEEGLLGRDAVQILSSSIDVVLDDEGKTSLSNRTDLEYLWQTPKMLNMLQNFKIPLLSDFAKRSFFNRLSISYDCARSFVTAQDESLKLLKSIVISSSESNDVNITDNESEQLESEIYENRIQGLTFIRNLRDAFPEIYSAIETRQAVRSLLNHERQTISKLLGQRRLENDEAEMLLENVEERMKELMDTPPQSKLPISEEMLYEIPWLSNLPTKSFEKIIKAFENRVYAVGEDIVKNKRFGEDIFIIVRGSAKVTIGNKVKDILGAGSVIGELSLLTGLPRTATVTAESPVTALRLSANEIFKLMKEIPDFEEKIWNIAGVRFAENLFEGMEPYNKLNQTELKHWLSKGATIMLEPNEELEVKNSVAIILSGSFSPIYDTSKKITAPVIINAAHIIAIEKSYVFLCKMQEV